MTPSPRRAASERRLLALLLALGLLRGLWYALVIPPWQHYDEPTHFEYVRLIAEWHRLPREGDLDLRIRREIAASMDSSGFWGESPPADPAPGEAPYIGVSELYHPPLYYLFLAVPQLPLAGQAVETQLYAARLTSLLFYLVTLVAAYGAVRELVPQRPGMALAVTAFLALLPPFTDLMSGVNNDAGAAATAAAALWALARLARRGPSLGRLALAACLIAACAATKSTAGLVAVAMALALALTWLPRTLTRPGSRSAGPSEVESLAATSAPQPAEASAPVPQGRFAAAVRQPAGQRRLLRLAPWAAAGALCLLAGALAVDWRGYAAWWSSGNPATAPNRFQAATALGRWTLELGQDGRRPRMVSQELPRSGGLRLRGRTVTFGAWLRAAGGSGGLAVLNLKDGRSAERNWFRVQTTTEWQFYAFRATVSPDAPGVALEILLPQRSDAASQLFVDGAVLVEGELPTGEAPRFDDGPARAGLWGERAITNLLRNGSAESGWPAPSPWLGQRTLFREPLLRVVQSAWELRRTGWVYLPEALILFQSFWGGFGWNHLSLPAPALVLPALLTLLAGAGLVRLWRDHRLRGEALSQEQWRAWVLVGAALLVAWGGAVLRIHPVFVTRFVGWPVARYAAAAFVPTALLLCAGLAAAVPRRWQGLAAWAGLLGLLLLDAVAMGLVILPHYYG